MGIVNGLMNELGDALFALLSFLHPVLTILVLAVLVAAGSLVVFKWTSDQEKIRAGKGTMKAHLLGVVIFRHDLRQVFRALFLSLFRSVTNLRFLLLPLAVMCVPLTLLFIQFELRLGARGLLPGETVVLRVHVDESASLDDVALEAEGGIRVETPGVRVNGGGLREVDFRLRVESAGLHTVTVRAGGHEIEKRIHATPGMLSPVRPGAGFLARLLNPAESPIEADAPVESVELVYPTVTYAFLGIDWAWWVLFLVFMILALFALRGPLGVDF